MAKKWSRLDNMAKIFPPTSSRRGTNVFRFVCELHTVVDSEILQRALEKTMERFAYYRCVLKKGFFWYYLEESALVPVVCEDNRPPCSPIYDVDVKKLLFEVSYYKDRINLEVYHALSDGTGALHFLQTHVINYLIERHSVDFTGELPPDSYDASSSQIEDDSFLKYYAKTSLRREKEPRAYRPRGERLPENRLGVIEAEMATGDILAAARRENATMAEFIAALLIYAIHGGMSLEDERRPVSLSVPVNLRRFFPSESSRNFFTVLHVRHAFTKDGKTFDEILTNMRRIFRESTTPEALRERMNLYASIEHSLPSRIAPLAVKIPVLKIARAVNERAVTAGLSNIGIVNMPEGLRAYVRCFDVIFAANRPQICICSYQGTTMLSFTSPFASTDIQRRFFRELTGRGIKTAICTNLSDLGR